MRDQGFRTAETLGWLGDVIDGPFVAGLPSPTPLGLANMVVAWRRGLDGETFVTSPVELPWLGLRPDHVAVTD